jgi:uncharacterized protein YdbL (DUF1318 family)
LTRRRLGFGALCAGAVLAVTPVVVHAQARPLDAPRAAGLVGERYDGMAVVRGAAPADVAALVASANAERKNIYADRAATDRASVDAIGRIYAVEIIKSAPTKTWFLSESGQWSQK